MTESQRADNKATDTSVFKPVMSGNPVLMFLKRAWRGEERLWKVFWLIGVPLVVFDRIVEEFMPPIVGLEILIPYTIFRLWYIVSVWRCSPNVDRRQWTWLGRAAVITGISMTIMDLYKELS